MMYFYRGTIDLIIFQKLKVLYFIDTLGSGGKERRLFELLKALKSKQGIEFELVVMSNDIHYREIFNLGIIIHKVLRKTTKNITVFRRLYLLLKNYKPDIVHCWDGVTAVYAAPVCKLLDCRLVNGMITNCPLRRNILHKNWLRARFTFPFSDVILSNSKAGLKAYKAPNNKSVVIYNGFNFERTQKLTDKEVIRKELNITTNFIVGMVANFRTHKDYPTYYNAAQLLLEKRRDVTFLAIGANTDSPASRNLIEEKNIVNFRLLGTKSDVESLINIMDICVLSTFSEGISNSILEYMALGKPVIATKGGGTREIVTDGVTGLILAHSSPVELAGKIEILLNDPELRGKMGLKGRERVENEFSIHQMAEKYINIYKGLVSN
jgi:glycosyltransferase involved in cell wall biosynthesis